MLPEMLMNHIYRYRSQQLVSEEQARIVVDIQKVGFSMFAS